MIMKKHYILFLDNKYDDDDDDSLFDRLLVLQY